MKPLFKTNLAGYDIELIRQGKVFTVNYGMQSHTLLSRHEAAIELGYCIMHALELEGKLD